MASLSVNKVRLAVLIFPPAGFVLLWWRSHLRTGRKLGWTLLLLLYSLLYAGLIIFVLLRLNWLQLEWRGGFPPVLTFSKTVPDYEALEAHRERQLNANWTNASVPPQVGGVYWTGFRGPARDGHYQEQPIRTNWPASGLPLLWRQPIGGGYASFAVAQGIAFTLEQRRENEVVSAYDLMTGRELWTHSYQAWFNDRFEMGGEGPRSTPLWDEGRLYALGATGHFHCLEARTGQVLWAHDLLEEERTKNLEYGCAASPLIVDNKVIVVGGHGENALLAYDKRSGDLAWKGVRRKPAYSSPTLVILAGQRQILFVAAEHTVGVDPEDGSELWAFPWTVQYDNNAAQPVLLGSNRFLLSAGYGTGCVALELEQTSSGLQPRELWRNRYLKNKFTSSVFHENYIYGLDESILTCLDAATGERMWKDGRYGYGQLLLASGHLVVLSGYGDLILVKATPRGLEEAGRFPALEGKTWNHPAIADGRLLVRNALEMACFQIGLGN